MRLRLIGGMIPDPPWPAREECARQAHTNLGDPESYPGLREVHDDVVERFSRIVFDSFYPGVVTSGASESNLLAILYWRGKGKRRVVALSPAHYSVGRAAYIAGLDYIEVEPSRLPETLSSSDIVVATLGFTETGGVHPLDEVADLAAERGAAIHVDAAYYGAIARHSPGGGPARLRLDPALATMAVDLHKIPEAPPPAGVLFAWSEEVIESLRYDSPYHPGRRQFGALGTRPGCSVYAASVSLRLVMEEWPGGPRGLAESLNGMVEEVSESLEDYGYRWVGGPAPVRCLLHGDADRIHEKIKGMGYRVYRCLGRGVRIVAMPHHLWEGYEWMIGVLREAAGGD